MFRKVFIDEKRINGQRTLAKIAKLQNRVDFIKSLKSMWLSITGKKFFLFTFFFEAILTIEKSKQYYLQLLHDRKLLKTPTSI